MKKNNLLATVPSWGKDWKVSFKLKLTGTIGNQYGSIIHFTTGKNYQLYGSRVPAVWTNPSKTSLHICSAISGNRNKCFNTASIKLNQFVNIRIEQRYVKPKLHHYSIYINGKRISSIINTDARVFKNVKIYAGDPWHNPAKGFITDLSYISLGSTPPKPVPWHG